MSLPNTKGLWVKEYLVHGRTEAEDGCSLEKL
jgi:hypothetical protein